MSMQTILGAGGAIGNELAKALTTLVQNPALRQRMGDAGLKRALRLFDEKTILQTTTRLLTH